jgi:hypothetical protein
VVFFSVSIFSVVTESNMLVNILNPIPACIVSSDKFIQNRNQGGIEMSTKQNLQIEGTNTLPTVLFSTEGKLKIEGKIIPDNALPFFEILFNWISDLDATKVEFDINIEYMNTSASMQLFKLLRTLEENCLIEELCVNWHYEEDDEDHYDTGQLFEEKLFRTKFIYCSFV